MGELFLVGLDRNSVKFQPMVDKPEAMLTGNALLEGLDLGRMKFDHLASAQINEMVMMLFGHGFVTRAAITKIVALDDAYILEQFDCAVNGRHGNARIDQYGTPVQFLDIGMIIGAIENTGDDPALLGHAHTAL